MTKLSKAVLAVAVASLALATLAAAAQAPAGQHAAGTIAKLDAAAGIIQLQVGNANETFALEPSTAIYEHGKSVAISKLVTGDKVEITWSSKNGKNVASQIRLIHPAQAAQPAKATPKR